MILFYQPNLPEDLFLDGDESRHCVKVLRKKAGDVIRVTDGKGYFYDAVIVKADAARCSIDVREKIPERARDFYIHIAISPTKNADRIEWFVEKATELGIDRITLLDCRNTERTSMKTDRLRKVAISAMKQSFKATLPDIGARVLPFPEVVEQCREEEKCIAFVDPANPTHLRDAVGRGRSYCVLVGPEGDFSPEEVAAATARGFVKVTLGPSRLRTETAGMAACHILNLINQ